MPKSKTCRKRKSSKRKTGCGPKIFMIPGNASEKDLGWFADSLIKEAKKQANK